MPNWISNAQIDAVIAIAHTASHPYSANAVRFCRASQETASGLIQFIPQKKPASAGFFVWSMI
jgi:hypothetical protein